MSSLAPRRQGGQRSFQRPHRFDDCEQRRFPAGESRVMNGWAPIFRSQINPNDGTHLYVAFAVQSSGTPHVEVYESTNSGVNWSSVYSTGTDTGLPGAGGDDQWPGGPASFTPSW
ncbi:MAG: hypothetical protein QM796_05460 [Chthoniobacteraceae bacterium]